jgi:predicted transcriptional regulator
MSDIDHELLGRYLGPLELRIMQDVWDHGPSTVNDVLDRLNDSRGRSLVYNTVMSTLARLADKGYLKRHREGRAYVYGGDGPSAFLRDRAAETTRELVDTLGEVAVAGIVDGLETSGQARDLIRRLLAEQP